MAEKEPLRYGEIEAEAVSPIFNTLRAALLKSADQFAQHIVDDKLNADGEIEEIDGPMGAMAAAFLTAYASRRLELDSKRMVELNRTLVKMTSNLVWLTKVLIGATVVLGLLTAILIWRTFV